MKTKIERINLTIARRPKGNYEAYAPISVKPKWGGGGRVGHRVGILTFSKRNYQNPYPRAKKNCQN